MRGVRTSNPRAGMVAVAALLAVAAALRRQAAPAAGSRRRRGRHRIDRRSRGWRRAARPELAVRPAGAARPELAVRPAGAAPAPAHAWQRRARHGRRHARHVRRHRRPAGPVWRRPRDRADGPPIVRRHLDVVVRGRRHRSTLAHLHNRGRCRRAEGDKWRRRRGHPVQHGEARAGVPLHRDDPFRPVLGLHGQRELRRSPVPCRPERRPGGHRRGHADPGHRRYRQGRPRQVVAQRRPRHAAADVDAHQRPADRSAQLGHGLHHGAAAPGHDADAGVRWRVDPARGAADPGSVRSISSRSRPGCSITRASTSSSPTASPISRATPPPRASAS